MGKSILVVVPARCGSKGIKLKNLKKINGQPLVTIVGNVVEKLTEIDCAIVSTDCSGVAEAAKKGGLEVPFFRPNYLSGDIISDFEVLDHALSEMENQKKSKFDIICMLQPTCPLRTPEHVRGSIEKLVNEGFDSVWTVSETDSKSHPYKQLTANNDGSLEYYTPEGENIIARQQLKPVYHRNGAAYVMTRECITDQKTIKGQYSGAYVIDDYLANIDTYQDIEYCEFLLNKLEKK